MAARVVLAPGVDRHAAADWQHDGGRSQLRLHRRPRRGEHLQHQPELRPGHRHRTIRSATSAGVRSRNGGWSTSGSSRATPTITASRRASRSASATAGRRRAPTRWPASGTARRRPRSSRIVDGEADAQRTGVRRGRGPRRRVPAWRPATSGIARSFNGIWDVGARLPGERPLLLRLRRAPHDDLWRRPAQRRAARPSASSACVRTARSSRATTSSATRSTASTCGCRSGSASAAPLDGRVRRGVQPVQPRELRLLHDAGEQRELRAARPSTATSPTRRGCCSSASGWRSDDA